MKHLIKGTILIVLIFCTFLNSVTPHIDIDKKFLEAVEKEDLSTLEDLLIKGADINIKNDDGETPLLIASSKGNINMVNLLLNRGKSNIFSCSKFKAPNVNEKSTNGSTALMRATGKGYTEIVKALLAKGANVNIKTDGDFTALMIAAQNGYVDIINALLRKGADINTKIDNGPTPLIQAIVFSNSYETVKILIDKGADVNARAQGRGITALMRASGEGHKEIVRLLLEKGANVNINDDYGLNAVTFAAGSGHTEIVDLLKKAGASDLSTFKIVNKSSLPIVGVYCSPSAHHNTRYFEYAFMGVKNMLSSNIKPGDSEKISDIEPDEYMIAIVTSNEYADIKIYKLYPGLTFTNIFENPENKISWSEFYLNP